MVLTFRLNGGLTGLDWARTKWGKFAKTYIKFGEIQAAKHADEIIVLSRSVQRYFEEKYGVKTTYIPNGVNRPEIVEADYITKEWGLEKDSYVLFLGRIVPEKGLKYLLQAWKKVKTNKKLVIAGGSSDSNGFFNELKEMATGDIVLVKEILIYHCSKRRKLYGACSRLSSRNRQSPCCLYAEQW